MKKVKLKSREEFKRMEREGEIEHVHTSDSGEWSTYVAKSGLGMTFWWEDYGSEYAVVDHPSPISKDSFEKGQIFFEDEEDED